MCRCACGTHTHEEAKEYKNDAEYHWFPCIDEDCDVTFNKVAHTWGVGEITTKPTSAKDGVMSYLCTVCKRLKQVPVKYNPNPTVSDSQWENAFSLSKFNNVVAHLTEAIEYDGVVSKWEYTIQANEEAVYMTMVFYENGVEKQYVGKYQENNYLWTFTDKNQVKGDVEPTISRDIMNSTAVLTDNGFDKLKDMFDKFTHNKETGYYEARDVVVDGLGYGYKNISVKMGDGRVLEIKATTTQTPGMEISVSYSNYGEAKPTPPTNEKEK